MRSFLSCLFIVVLLFCCAFSSYAQEDDSAYNTEATTDAGEEYARPVNNNNTAPTDAQWQQISTGKDFDYKDQREFTAVPAPKSNKEFNGLVKLIIGIVRFFSSLAGKVVLWTLLILLVAFLAYRIFKGDGRLFARRNKKILTGDEGQTDVSEDDLLHRNWEEQLRAALAAGDTRMAIRYSYMLLLQLLQARNLIQYRQDKTNTDYFRELGDSPVRQQFRQLTRNYEYAWYGNFLPSADAFEAYLQLFNGVKKGLGAS